VSDLAAAVRDIQERVRRRHPQTAKGDLALADLLPIVHARDIAASKVAAIGRVNPRPGGPLNSLIQSVKNTIARSLNWFVRDQVEFNRGLLQCVEALLEAHNETNRALAELADRVEGIKTIDLPPLRDDAKQLQDIRSHWVEWRKDWERKLTINEAQFMRAVSDLQLAYQQRLRLSEADTRDKIALQHRDYLNALDRATRELQQKLWDDFAKLRTESRASYERMVHEELRLLRQKPLAAAALAAPEPIAIDWLAFADKFRGREDDIRQRFQRYVPLFANRPRVLDLGCGRGEFLSLVPAATGIDASPENVALCRQKGHVAEQADIFEYLQAQPEASLGGIFCAQVIEHLTAAQLPRLVQLCAAKLQPGAPILFETPNPESLAIFATHFFIDPTHTRPVPPALLHFYLHEAGFRSIETERLGTAANHFPELAQLPEPIRQRFFGGLDYAVRAER
jgi:2-polyprenyl-3-methyl-5-hydroxy-6-metoxy-1,4-benzoquinol methylase